MAVTLAAARRLGAIHHRLEPTGHVHLQHLVTPDEAMPLEDGHGRRDTESYVTVDHWVIVANLNKMFIIIRCDWHLTSSPWYFGLFL